VPNHKDKIDTRKSQGLRKRTRNQESRTLWRRWVGRISWGRRRRSGTRV